MQRQKTNERSSEHSHLTVDEVREYGRKIVSILGLMTFPVGVYFATESIMPADARRLESHRYCQALMQARHGQRVTASTAVLQATCVDATIIPFLEKRLNFGFGCYGCRDATDLAAGESIIGFPVAYLASIVAHLEYLNTKAIPTSRGKKAWRSLEKSKNKNN